MAAALRPPRLRTPGAPAAAAGRVDEGAARQGRGSVGAPDLSCSATGARPPEPQPQREPGNGQEAGARWWQRLRGRRPRRRQRGPAWPQPPPTPAGPADRQSEVPRAGARAEAGRGRQWGSRSVRRCALAPAPGQGVPAGPVPRKLPGARAARAGRGGAHREEAGLGLRAPGAGTRAPFWALPSGAVQCRGRGPGAPRRDLKSLLSLK